MMKMISKKQLTLPECILPIKRCPREKPTKVLQIIRGPNDKVGFTFKVRLHSVELWCIFGSIFLTHPCP